MNTEDNEDAVQTWIWPPVSVRLVFKMHVVQLHMHANQTLCGNNTATCDLTWPESKWLATWLGLELWPTDLELDLTCPMAKRLVTWLGLATNYLRLELGLPTNDLWLDLDLQKMTCIHLWSIAPTFREKCLSSNEIIHFKVKGLRGDYPNSYQIAVIPCKQCRCAVVSSKVLSDPVICENL